MQSEMFQFFVNFIFLPKRYFIPSSMGGQNLNDGNSNNIIFFWSLPKLSIIMGIIITKCQIGKVYLSFYSLLHKPGGCQREFTDNKKRMWEAISPVQTWLFHWLSLTICLYLNVLIFYCFWHFYGTKLIYFGHKTGPIINKLCRNKAIKLHMINII